MNVPQNQPGHVVCPLCKKSVKRKFFDNHTAQHPKKPEQSA